MAYAIETEKLSKTYKTEGKSIQALESLDLQISEGETFGFLGPNGAGKTTAIKLITGLITPTSGRVSVLGKEAGSPEAKKDMGYLSEVAYYYTFMEAEKLLRYYSSLKGISGRDADKRIEENLRLTGLYDRRKERLKGYSKGMQQRFGIALALMGNPRLLILDEPTSGLDPIGRKEVKDIIKTLKNKGITIFLSSHHLSEVETVCDTIGVVNKGRTVCMKKLSEFLNYDKDVYTMRFKDNDGKIAESLKGRISSMRQEEDGTMRLTAPKNDVPEIFGVITGAGGVVLDTIPGYGNLEETFFDLIVPKGKDGGKAEAEEPEAKKDDKKVDNENE